MKEQWKLNQFNLQLCADDADNGDNGQSGNDADGQQNDQNQQDQQNKQDQKEKEKSFTQKELDDILTKRLARERKAWEQALEDEKKKAAMTEAEKLKAEKEEAEKKSAETLKTANQRLIKAEVKAACVELGIVDADAAFLLMQKDEVTVSDAGDVTGVKEALKSLAETKPYLVKQAEQNKGPGGVNPAGGNGGKTFTRDQINKMSPDEINRNWDTIQELLKAGKI